MTCSTAFLFITGSEPGIPVQTGQQRVFGSPPNAFLHPQNILLSVKSSAWHSIPTTGSYSGMFRATPHLLQKQLHIDYVQPAPELRHDLRQMSATFEAKAGVQADAGFVVGVDARN